jgi:hypothetical protein
MRQVAVTVAALVVLAGCGAVPQPRREVKLEQAANKADVTAILDRYREVRNAAISLLDPKPLSIVETGPMLAIDTGSFEVAQRLSRTQSEEQRQLQVTSIETPVFSKYPLWFMVTAYDPAARVDLVQIFERMTPVDPWLLVAAPQTVPSTRLPNLRHDGEDHVIPVAATNGKGMAMSPQKAAAAYAKVLGSTTGESSGIARDDFIRKMRAAFDQANQLEGVRVTQSWAAERVEHALRTDDGGALVWVTLLRLDNYQVQPGIKVSWPAGSPQQAFLANGISGSGKLRYYHQVLLHLPGGDGKPRALGQYGGVVSADAQAALAPVPAPGSLGGVPGAPAPFPIPGASGTPNPSAPAANPSGSSSAPTSAELLEQLKRQQEKDD